MKKKKIISILGVVLFFILLLALTSIAFYYKKNATSLNALNSENKETLVIDENSKQEKINIELSTDIDLQEKREEYHNNDIVARLEIPDLFNILIVHGTDNEFYLNHDLSRKKDIKGTEYLDYRVTTESKQINIYGHNSRTYNIPFRKLEKFLDKKYFDEHEYIVLQNQKNLSYIFN